jgi:hypothetical protein
MLIHSLDKKGFHITVEALPEYINPADMFDDDATIEGIRNGTFEWFMVRVTASKNGIKLGTDYLGSCCYRHYLDFIDDDYLPDMIERAITESKEIISKLVQDNADTDQ